MHEYDITLKSVLQRCLAGSALADWAGVRIARWHNVELPEVRTRHADLLGEDASGHLVHIELQSHNETQMALRMAEYALSIYRKFGRWARQMVLYVGNEPLRMSSALNAPGWTFRYHILDIREIDCAVLLKSRSLDDNVLAILADGNDRREIARRILRRIARSRGTQRERAIAELLRLSGLRGSAGVIIREETERMPILDDIMEHPVIGPERRKAMKIGIEKGIEKGRRVGREEGERNLIIFQARKRFGKLPTWAREYIESAKSPELKRIAENLLSAPNIKELLLHS